MRLSFDRKISLAVVIFAALLLLFFNFSHWYLYSQMKRFLEERVSREVRSLAAATAERVDPIVVEEILADQYILADYADLINSLESTKRANELLGLTIYDLEGKGIFDLPGDSLQTPLEILSLTEFTSATAGITATTPVYRSDSLYLLSAFAPILSYDDSVIAVLEAEAGCAVFQTIEDFRGNLVLMNVVSFLFMLLFAAGFYLVNKRLLTAQQALLRASAISSMGEMAATIAHEIRNPLGIIKNSAERIRRKYCGDVDDPALGFISNEVDRLNSIVAGYLDFAHPVQRPREEFDLSALVGTLVEQMKTDFSEAGIVVAISNDSADGPHLITGDRFAVRQAVVNLMLNAKDAQPRGGRLDISIRCDRHGGRRGTRIELADRGPGIPPGLARRVFDPFFTTREKGSGLGLHIAKNVVRAHGGILILKSNPGGGTVASLFLPGNG